MTLRERSTLVAAIAASLVLGLAAVALAAWSADASGSAQATAIADWRAPNVPASIIVGTSTGVVRQGNAYTIYAQVSDAGTPPSGVNTVTANVTSLTTGGSAVALPACASGCVVDGITYTHSSGSVTADNPLGAGSKTYNISTTDVAGNAGTVPGFTATVDNSLTVSITTGPATPTKLTTAAFTFTGSGTGFKCKLDTGSFAVCSSGQSYSSLAQGSHLFQVVSTQGATESSPASHTWLIDTTTPGVVLTFPVGAGVYGAATWNAGCSSAICGTASDTGGADLASVKVGIQRSSDNLWWNGSAFASVTEVQIAATGTSNWSLAFPASSLANGSYLVRAQSFDNATNQSTVSSASFNFDGVAPTVSSLVFNGAGTIGKPEEGETMVVTFSEAMLSSSFCNSWANDSTTKTLTGAVSVNIRNTTGNDTLDVTGGSCGSGQTFHFGSIDLGSTGYNTGTVDLTFGVGNGSNNTVLTWNPTTFQLTVKLGKLNAGTPCPSSCPASSTAAYTPDGGVADWAGNVVSGSGSLTGRLF